MARRGRSRRPQADLDQHAVERLLGEQHRAEHRGLGLDVLRRDAAAAASGGATATATAVSARRHSAVTMVLTRPSRRPTTSISTMWVPVLRIGSSSCTLRWSSFSPRACLDGVGDLLGGDGAEQPAVVAGLVRDREHGLAQQRGGLLGLRLGLRGGALGRLACARCASAIDAGVAGWASLRGTRKLRR